MVKRACVGHAFVFWCGRRICSIKSMECSLVYCCGWNTSNYSNSSNRYVHQWTCITHITRPHAHVRLHARTDIKLN